MMFSRTYHVLVAAFAAILPFAGYDNLGPAVAPPCVVPDLPGLCSRMHDVDQAMKEVLTSFSGGISPAWRLAILRGLFL
jgi:hypothetical protein